MNFEPQKLVLGLMDFFSILLPGALLTYLFLDDVGPLILGTRYPHLDGIAAWTAFLFASYLIGHPVFLAGSWFDELYEWSRRRTLDAQIKLAANHGALLPWPVRLAIWLVFKGERNLAVRSATRIKHQSLSPLGAKEAVNTFQWSKALLGLESAESLAVVNRFEADSKFFRCFAVVLLIVLVTWPLPQPRTAVGVLIVLLLLVLAVMRYMEQRLKATNQAYWSVITLTARAGKVAPEKPTQGGGGRAGGLVFRRRGRSVVYLLVDADEDPSILALPNAPVEGNEHERETAVRVVHATGIWGRIVDDLGSLSYPSGNGLVNTRFYLMEATARGAQLHRSRHEWLPLATALERTRSSQAHQLLRAADSLLAAPASASFKTTPARLST